MLVVIMLCSGAIGLFAAQSSAAEVSVQQLDDWGPRLEPYVSHNPDGSWSLSAEKWAEFVATLSPQLRAHFEGSAKLKNDPDVAAINALRKAIREGNKLRTARDRDGEAMKSCIKLTDVEDAYYKITVKVTGRCARSVLALMHACKRLPWPLNKISKSKFCELAEKAQAHYDTSQQKYPDEYPEPGFKLKYYFWRNKANVGY